MTISAEKVAELALALTRDERAVLADRLVESLDPMGDAELRAFWAVETVRRIDDVRSGRIDTVSLAEVKAQIESALR
ncbi:MAG TPA: addiction module protein [Pseudomonadota bacterium]|jgi:putative addiction module component (TIGR02574 family)|nr:addiction module protein [Pseudomonadota bacterium]